MEKKPLYIYDDTNNEVPYYIPASYVRVDSDNDTTLADFYSAYNSSTDSVINADTGRVEIGKSPIVVLDSMGEDLDGSNDHAVATGQYIYTPLNKKIRFVKNVTAGENRYYDVDQRVIYCNKKTDKLYRFNGERMVEVGNLNFVNSDTLYRILTDYTPLYNDNKVHPSYSRILPVESMGEALDNVGLEEGDPAWFTFEPDPHIPCLWINTDTNGEPADIRDEQGYAIDDVNTYTRYVNRHTGRSYHWSGVGINFVEEPTPGTSVTPEALIPYVGRDGYWYVGDTNQGVLAQGPAGSVTVADNLDSDSGDIALSAKQGFILKREFLRLIEYLKDGNINSFVPNWDLEDTNRYSIITTGTGFTVTPVSGITGMTGIEEGTTDVEIQISPKPNYKIIEVIADMDGTHGDGVFRIGQDDQDSSKYNVRIAVITGNVHIAVRAMYTSVVPYTPGGSTPQQGTIDTNTESNTVDGNG